MKLNPIINNHPGITYIQLMWSSPYSYLLRLKNSISYKIVSLSSLRLKHILSSSTLRFILLGIKLSRIDDTLILSKYLWFMHSSASGLRYGLNYNIFFKRSIASIFALGNFMLRSEG